MNAIRQAWRVWLALFLGVSTGTCAAAKPGAKPEAVNVASFKLIAQRNIFNQNRSVRAPRPVAAKPPRVESFGLTGTLCSEKGTFAFFDGTSSAYRKVVKPEETIAGYKVAEIAPDVAKLEAGEKKLVLHVGTQLRREDKGEWEVATAPVAYALSSSGKSNSSFRESHNSGPDPRHKPSPKHGKPDRSDNAQLSKNDLKAFMKMEEEVYAKGEAKDVSKDEVSRLFKEEMKGLPKQDVKSVKEALKRLTAQ